MSERLWKKAWERDDWMKEWHDDGEPNRVTPWRHALLVADLRMPNGHSDSTGKYVALVLSAYMNSAGLCHPGKETLATQTMLHERTVDRAISRLLDSGWLTLVAEGGGTGNTNLYGASLP